MNRCSCQARHTLRRVVLTGGPGAGKTAVLELVRMVFCSHLLVLPESASIVFGGGFPRGGSLAFKRAAQRAIFYTQRELETAVDTENAAIVLCDRGTIDGTAYWPGPDDFLGSVGTSLDDQLRRYSAVIHLRPPSIENGYDHRNPLRTESAEESAAIDARIALAWEGHPRRFVVEPSPHFLTKALAAVDILRGEMPECCRQNIGPLTSQR